MAVSKIRSLCIDMITKFNDDRSYVLAVIGCLQTDDEVQRIIDFIQSDDSITAYDIVWEAMHINQERDFSEELKEALERYLRQFGEYYPLAVSGTKSDDEIVKDIDRCLATNTKEKSTNTASLISIDPQSLSIQADRHMHPPAETRLKAVPESHTIEYKRGE